LEENAVWRFQNGDMDHLTQWANIRFYNQIGKSATETLQILHMVYGKQMMSQSK
jgi:hypothetical protein